MRAIRYALPVAALLAYVAYPIAAEPKAAKKRRAPSGTLSNDVRDAPDYCGRPGCTPGKPYRGKFPPPRPSGCDNDPLCSIQLSTTANHTPSNPNAPSSATRVFRSLNKRLNHCADRRGFQGPIVLGIRLHKSGRVRRVRASGATAKLHRCVRRTVQSARFGLSHRPRHFEYSISIGSHIPDALARQTRIRSLRSLKPQFDKCGRLHRFQGIMHARMTVKPSGRLQSVHTKNGTEKVRRCVERSLRRSRFPRSKTTQSFTYSLRIGLMPTTSR